MAMNSSLNEQSSHSRTDKKVKIAAMADLHMHKLVAGIFKETFTEISEKADILVLCGDLTDHGHKEEAELLLEDLTFCKIPVVGVLGNHDFEAGESEEVKRILSKGMFILDEESVEIKGVGFAGVKGFGGGFDTHMLGRFGEKGMKNFVQEVIDETLKLEASLGKLRTDKKIVALHYSPIRQTCIGEPEEIFPFLGSSRLAEPIDNFKVTAVFHGHSHYGSPEGKTITGIPVYNVALKVLSTLKENNRYKIIEI